MLWGEKKKKKGIVGRQYRKKDWLLNRAYPESGKDVLFSIRFSRPQLVACCHCKGKVGGVRCLLLALQECWNKNITCWNVG